jgi:Divergent InlB B-repeat domain
LQHHRASFAIAILAAVAFLALPSLASAATQTLSVEKAGTGTGTVTSSPAGIECGATCQAPFAEGQTVLLTAAAGANTATAVWSGCDKVNLENQCSVTIKAASRSVTATFNLIERTLSVTRNGTGTGTVTSSPAGIECGATCQAKFPPGTVTLTGTPDASSKAVVWLGCASVDAENRCLVTMSAAKSVTATFELLKRQLSVSKTGSATGTIASSPAGIECGATCQASFAHGTAVTLLATPGLHSQAAKWTGCDNVTLENKCLVAMSAARSVSATFELEPQFVQYTVTVQRIGTGTGTVTSSPAGIDCGADCTEPYLYKTHLTLTATPAAGSVFDHWSGGSCAGTGPCEATINSSRLVKAVFVAIGKRTLTVSKAGTGTGTVTSKPAGIDCGATCSAEFDASAKVVLSAAPAPGSSFAGWSGEGCAGTSTCKVAMNEARNLTASFTQLPLSPSVLSVAGSAKVKGAKAQLRLTCSGASPCNGTLKLIAKIKSAQGRARGLVIASAPFGLAAGVSSTLGMRLSQRGIAMLRDAGRLRVRVTGGGLQAHALRLSLPGR